MDKLKSRELRQSYGVGYDRMDSYGSYDSYGGAGGCCHYHGCYEQYEDGGILLPLVVAAIAGAVGFAGGYLANIVVMGGGKRSFDPSIPIAQNIMQGIFIFKKVLTSFFK